MRVPNVPSSSIKLMLFPFSLEGETRIWLEKEPPRSILTWDDLVTKFINQFFPPSKTTNLRNEIMRFQQRFDELFYEAWDRFNDLIKACPHHGFSELHQLNTFYNALNVNDQDSLNSAVGAKAVVAKVSTSSSTPAISSKVTELKDMVRALLLDKKNQSSAPAHSPTLAPVKAVETNCVTCGGAHSYQNCPATSENVYRDNIQEYVSQAAAINFNQGNTGFRPQMVANQIRPPGFPPIQTHQNNQNNFNWGNNFNQNRGAYQALAYKAPIPPTQSVFRTDFESNVKANDVVLRNMQNQGQNMQNQCQSLQSQMANLTDMLSKFVSYNTASSLGSGTLPSNIITNPKEYLKGITTRSGVAYQGLTIPTPSKVVKQGTEVTKDQVKTPSSQSTAPVQPPVVQSETQTTVSEPVVAPVSALMPNLKPSIPYHSRRDNERHRDQDNEQIKKLYEIFKDMSFEISFTDALILMAKFASTLKVLIGNKEKLRMDECLALAYLGASVNLMPLSVWEGLSLPELTQTCMTLKLADRSVFKPIGIAKDVSVKTDRALIDVHKGELTLCIGNETITYNFAQTPRYSANYNQMTANKIDVIDMACEEYSQEVLGFSQEADAFLGLEDDPNLPEFNPFYYDPEGDILLLEAILNIEPLSPLLNHEQYTPSFKKELKVCEAKTVKSFIDEPPEVELKDLPPHLEYAFLEGDNKLPIIIAKELGDEEKSALIKVLMSHKRAIAWKLSNIQEVEKLLDAGLIYLISDSLWVSPVHCVPKKGGFTIVENEENELIPTHLVTGWRVCIDYQKLNEASRKDHFPLPFMDQMLETLARNEYYCFLDGFFRYFQIPIDPRDQEKTTFTCPYGTFAYRHMLFGLSNAPGTFQRCMLAIFNDMVEKTMEVFMDDFSVFGNSFENCLSRLDKMLQCSPWFADFANYHAGNFINKDQVIWRCVHGKEALDILEACHNRPTGDIMVLPSPPRRFLMLVSFVPPSTRMPTSLSNTVTRANDKEQFQNVMRCLKTPSKFVKCLTFGALTFWARSCLHEGTNIFSWLSIICQNGLKRKRSPPMTPELFASSLNLSSPDLVPLELS
nr:reverse transcriptase domain-containing protein [Tanacetum cinerariifolium]